MDNKIKGYLYEIQIRDYIINNLNKPAFLWPDAPETLLLEHKIIGSHNEARLKRKETKLNPLQDTGIDIIQVDSNDKVSFVQCKNGYKSGVTMNDLAGFPCGHIIAEANGGLLKLDNLKPVCVSCNSSMGTQNMDEYILKYGL